MASEDNSQVNAGVPAQQTEQIAQTEQTVRNVTGYIHTNPDDDLSKIFAPLHQFRASHGLKYSHHHDFIFFSVKSSCLSELAKVQPFRISHYRSNSEYSCTKELADKLLTVRDSFVRMSWNETEGLVQFLSRTIGRVHNQLVYRIFKSCGETFVRSNYHFIRAPREDEESGEVGETGEQVGKTQTSQVAQVSRVDRVARGARVARGGRGGRGGHGTRGGHGGHGTQDSADGFTRVTRDKSKYNRNKVQVDSGAQAPRAPRTRGSVRRGAHSGSGSGSGSGSTPSPSA
jgi:hypothetical protein